MKKKKLKPDVPLHNPNFVYTPTCKTDVQATWRKFGWTPKEKQNAE